MKRIVPLVILVLVFAVAGSALAFRTQIAQLISPDDGVISSNLPPTSPTPTPSLPIVTPSASPSATPTPAELSFDEMNSRYGPCTNTPVLMYHHIAPNEDAVAGHFTALNVTPTSLESHLSYLNQKGYTTIAPADLINFFHNGAKLPSKSIMLTFDDGYDDFAKYAVPLLHQYSAKGTLFLPTGLTENPGYLTWSQIGSFDNTIYVGNHTWSHHNVAASADVVNREVTTATTQLTDHGGLDPLKVFAYPYGTINDLAVKTLSSLNFNLAFTTKHGRILCAKQALALPRIRVGNANLGNFL